MHGVVNVTLSRAEADALCQQIAARIVADLGDAFVRQVVAALTDAGLQGTGAGEASGQKAVLTPAEIAEEYGVSVETVRRHVRAGKLPAHVWGDQIRIRRTEFEAYQEALRVERAAKAERARRRGRRNRASA